MGHGAAGGDDFAVGIILITGDYITFGIHHLHHIALKVGDVVVGHAVSLHGVGVAIGIVEEIRGIAALCLPQKLSAGIEEIRSGAVYRLGGSQTVGIISIGDIGRTVSGSGQAPAVLPGKGIPRAVVGAGRAAHSIAGDQLSIETQQKVLPVAGRIGVSMPVSSQNVAKAVVSVGIGLVTHDTDKKNLTGGRVTPSGCSLY